MLRLLAATAILGLASAQQADRAAIQLRDALRETQADADNLDTQIAASGAAAKLFGAGIAMVDDSVAMRVATLSESLTADEQNSRGLKTGTQNKLDTTQNMLDKELASTKERLSAELQAAVNDLTKKISTQKSAIDEAIVSRLSTVVKKSEAAKKDGEAMRSQMTEASKCQAEGQLYTGDKCVDPEMPDNSHLSKVYHKLWTNADGREGGFIDNREVAFTKNYDDTYIRIFWYDNIRTHGHTGNGRWNVYICDGGGGSCSHCNDPGKLQNWRHSSHQHNWWMNDHTGGTIFGLCKKTDSFDMKAGKYQLRIHADNAHYDMYTGQNQHGSFMVDEVMKY